MSEIEFQLQLTNLHAIAKFNLEVAEERARGINLGLQKTIKEYKVLVSQIEKQIKKTPMWKQILTID